MAQIISFISVSSPSFRLSLHFLVPKICLFFSVQLTMVAAFFYQICSLCVPSLSFLTTYPRLVLSDSFAHRLTAVLYLLCFLLILSDGRINFCCKLNTCWDRETDTYHVMISLLDTMLNIISVRSYGIKQNRLLQENENNYLKKGCINFGVNCIHHSRAPLNLSWKIKQSRLKAEIQVRSGWFSAS